jgi:hypothetical protein
MSALFLVCRACSTARRCKSSTRALYTTSLLCNIRLGTLDELRTKSAARNRLSELLKNSPPKMEMSFRELTVPTENSARPMADVIPPTGPRRSSSLRALLESGERNSPMHAGAMEHSSDKNFKGLTKERQRVAWWILALSGSASFVAVVQSADLRYRHDGPHSWRLNRSWLR